MKKEMANYRVPYFIAGDFNDHPHLIWLINNPEGLNNTFTMKGSGFLENTNALRFQIDYIAASKDLEVLNYNITQTKLSDPHFPGTKRFKI